MAATLGVYGSASTWVFNVLRGLSIAHRGAELPAARLRRTVDRTCFDDVTQIHRGHIGDQRIGKQRQHFDATEQAAINKRLAPYLRAFHYDLDGC